MALLVEVKRQEGILKTAHEEGRVIGLHDVTGEVLNRVDVDEMLTKLPKTFNLFLLALEYIQAETTANSNNAGDRKMSYFEIAGIHGLPQKWWDGVEGKVTKAGDISSEGSYCPHGTIHFPTWHRPYLAMMEQSIYYRILQIAQRFKDPQYLEAAVKFRMPYWDYFRPRGGESRFPGVANLKTGATTFPYDFSVPHILEVEEVMVARPESEDMLETVDNPLYQYRFPKKGGISPGEWEKLWKNDSKIHPSTKKPSFEMQASRSRTIRHAQNKNNQRSDFSRFNTVLAETRENNVEMMLGMLSHPGYKNYLAFSFTSPVYPTKTDEKGKAVQLYGSVEGLHNKYHGICGREGHMSRVPVAAFDPIFWLHHCNIDRVFAVWQAINRTYKWPSDDELKWYEIEERENDVLFPFRTPINPEHKFWSSKTVREVESFGYSYPELKEYPDPEQLLQNTFKRYAWSIQAYANLGAKIPDEMEPIDVRDAPVFRYNDRTLDTMLSREMIKPKVNGDKPLNDLTPLLLTSTSEGGVSLLSASSLILQATPLDPAIDLVEVKLPSQEFANETTQLQLSEGAPNESDSELLSKAGKSDNAHIIRQWYVDSLVERSALNGAFTIYYFVGDFPSALNDYEVAPTFAGLEHIFAAPAAVCDNCGHQEAEHQLAANTNPITAILLDYIQNGKLQDLHPENVVPFLRANLHWRVVGINSQPKASDDVAALEVTVSSAVSYYDPGTGVPEHIGGQAYPEVTQGRAGGFLANPGE